jgi:hypothetical protein
VDYVINCKDDIPNRAFNPSFPYLLDHPLQLRNEDLVVDLHLGHLGHLVAVQPVVLLPQLRIGHVIGMITRAVIFIIQDSEFLRFTHMKILKITVRLSAHLTAES